MFFLKKLNFSIPWRQTQFFLLWLISQPFLNQYFTLMAHFEAYITHMEMEHHKETHSHFKKWATTFPISLIEICGNKIWAKSCIFWHTSSLFSNIPSIYPPSVIHHWRCVVMTIHNPQSIKLYSEPIIGQKFDDRVPKLCKL